MGGDGFRRAEHRPCRQKFAQLRHVEFDDLRAQAFQHSHAVQHRLGQLGVHVLRDVLLVDSDSNPGHAALDAAEDVWRRVGQRSGIVGVEAGDRLEHDRDVGYAAGHGTDVVQRFSQRQHPVAAHPAPRGFQANDPARGGGEPDRPPSVAAQRAETEPGRHCNARAAGRHARRDIGPPRVHRDVEVRVVARHRAFGEVELSQQNSARRLQPRHHRRVEGGDVIGEGPGAAHRADSPGVAEVFDRDRRPVQRPPVAALGDLALGGLGRGHRPVRHHGRVALQAAVQHFDAGELLGGHLHRRYRLRLDEAREVANGQIAQIAIAHLATSCRPFADGVSGTPGSWPRRPPPLRDRRS